MEKKFEDFLAVIQSQSSHDAFKFDYSRRLLKLVLQGILIPPGEQVILPLDVETSYKE